MASGAADILVRARIVDSLSEALDGIHHACATAMTPRDFGPPTCAPREHFGALQASDQRVAFVFGSERLTGALLDRLTHHVHILEMNGDSYRLKTSQRRQRQHATTDQLPA